jgi:hypothetical protein
MDGCLAGWDGKKQTHLGAAVPSLVYSVPKRAEDPAEVRAQP